MSAAFEVTRGPDVSPRPGRIDCRGRRSARDAHVEWPSTIVAPARDDRHTSFEEEPVHMLLLLARIPSLGAGPARTLDVVQGRVWCPRRNADIDVDRCVGCDAAADMGTRGAEAFVECTARPASMSIVVPE